MGVRADQDSGVVSARRGMGGEMPAFSTRQSIFPPHALPTDAYRVSDRWATTAGGGGAYTACSTRAARPSSSPTCLPTPTRLGPTALVRLAVRGGVRTW